MACSASPTPPVFSASAADLMLVATDSFHKPTRVNVWEGMCSACGTDGAMSAYARVAGSDGLRRSQPRKRIAPVGQRDPPIGNRAAGIRLEHAFESGARLGEPE